MIRVTGVSGEVVRPHVTVEGEPIATLSAQFSVGQIAKASCGIRPESLGVLKEGGTIKSGEDILFTGEGWSPRGRATSNSLDFGFSLIHKAHRLDEGRAWAPGLHPLSTEHYTFTMGKGGADSRDYAVFGDMRLLNFDLTESLAKEIPSYLTKVMEHAVNERVSQNLKQVGMLTDNLAEQNARAIEVMNGIIPITPCRIAFKDLKKVGINVAAMKFLEAVARGSITANKSVWDLLSTIFSAFGMQVICWPDGTLRVCPDFSGCRPPEGNRISGGIIDSWEGSDEYTRSPRGVLVISHGFAKGESGVRTSNRNTPYTPLQGNVGQYITKGSGGLFITGLPPWMTAYPEAGLPVVPEGLASLYAKQIYAEVKNMGRTFAVSTPLAPDARPGTTYYIETILNAKNLTSGGDASSSFSAEYAGYCYKIVHSLNASGHFHTLWYFRNLFEPDEYDDMVDAAPFFDDKPFSIASSGDNTEENK